MARIVFLSRPVCFVVFRSPRSLISAIKLLFAATRPPSHRMHASSTEAQPRVTSTMFAEDPESAGEEPLDLESSTNLREQIVASHYSAVASRLNQPLLAASLQTGFIVPAEIRFPAMVWRMLVGPLAGMRFVGGYMSSSGTLRISKQEGQLIFGPSDPFRLDVPHGTFFGIEESIFRQVCAVARNTSTTAQLRTLEQPLAFYSAVSMMRDGTMLSPVDFLPPVAAESVLGM